MALTDDSGRFFYVNPVACELFGYAREPLLQMRLNDLVVPDTGNTEASRQEYLETGRGAGEFQFVRADGDVRIASYAAYRLVSGHHLRTLHDITEVRRAEQRLRESERERAYVMSSARCLIRYANITQSDHPDLLFWNSRFVEGRTWRAVGVCTDITVRKQALEALRESEEKHRALFTTMTQGVVYSECGGGCNRR